MDVFAYAKLNLALKITGQRPDGYHELDMVMQEISLCDKICIKKSEGLFVKANIFLPPDNTLAVAARVFFEYTRIRGGADIRIEKKIPAQAGLGGGSSDGAAVLCALDSLYGTGLDRIELCSLGKRVGADVPFFIVGGCMRARGTGEVLEPTYNCMKAVYLLAKPAGGVNTKEAYGAYHLQRKLNTDIPGVIGALAAGDMDAYVRCASNDLAPAALYLCPDSKKIISEMKSAKGAFITGSGSCVFGVYPDKKTALADQERLLKLSFVDFTYIAENR